MRDRDRIYGEAFREQVAVMNIKEALGAVRSTSQRAYVERVIGSIRRECLDRFHAPQRISGRFWRVPATRQEGKTLAYAKHVEISQNISPDVPLLTANPQSLHRLFLILIDNAIKYTPPSGTIAVRLACDLESTVVCVQDSGIEISSEDLPPIFERLSGRQSPYPKYREEPAWDYRARGSLMLTRQS